MSTSNKNASDQRTVGFNKLSVVYCELTNTIFLDKISGIIVVNEHYKI
jgi:hypothetical protein